MDDNDPGTLSVRWDMDGDGTYEAGPVVATNGVAMSPARAFAAGRSRVGAQVTGPGA